ncbi:MAG TPA: nitroreductase/quinone reductase family protein [Microbacteriaceae bacterium]|nr:nitroreductase/quinone reductase family protein [Microbacteriaceae bacterium]
MAEDPREWNRSIIEEFRSGGGTTRIFGRNLVLLHHRGAKTGTERVTPLIARHPDPSTWLLSASANGAPHNPAWYHNLVAHPDDVQIETPDDGTVPVRAEDLSGPAREKAWAQFVSFSDRYTGYQEKTTRTIPVLALHRQ